MVERVEEFCPELKPPGFAERETLVNVEIEIGEHRSAYVAHRAGSKVSELPRSRPRIGNVAGVEILDKRRSSGGRIRRNVLVQNLDRSVAIRQIGECVPADSGCVGRIL